VLDSARTEILNSLAARAGGASLPRGALRVTLWSALAMLATTLIGRRFA
jgi:VIT1/CCC1 family predicted Fe2+/Mn2+ transporter